MTFTPYSNSGPFINNSVPPGINATFLNNVENFLDQLDSSAAADVHITSDGAGNETLLSANLTGAGTGLTVQHNALVKGNLTVNAILALVTGSLTRIAKAGPFSVSTTLTAFNHGLGAVPDFVITSIDAGSVTAHQCYVEYSSLSSTQVKLQSDGSLTVYTLCIKF